MVRWGLINEAKISMQELVGQRGEEATFGTIQYMKEGQIVRKSLVLLKRSVKHFSPMR